MKNNIKKKLGKIYCLFKEKFLKRYEYGLLSLTFLSILGILLVIYIIQRNIQTYSILSPILVVLSSLLIFSLKDYFRKIENDKKINQNKKNSIQYIKSELEKIKRNIMIIYQNYDPYDDIFEEFRFTHIKYPDNKLKEFCIEYNLDEFYIENIRTIEESIDLINRYKEDYVPQIINKSKSTRNFLVYRLLVCYIQIDLLLKSDIESIDEEISDILNRDLSNLLDYDTIIRYPEFGHGV